MSVDENKGEQENFDELTIKIRQIIEKSEDMAECETAANSLDNLANNILVKMATAYLAAQHNET